MKFRTPNLSFLSPVQPLRCGGYRNSRFLAKRIGLYTDVHTRSKREKIAVKCVFRAVLLSMWDMGFYLTRLHQTSVVIAWQFTWPKIFNLGVHQYVASGKAKWNRRLFSNLISGLNQNLWFEDCKANSHFPKLQF